MSEANSARQTSSVAVFVRSYWKLILAVGLLIVCALVWLLWPVPKKQTTVLVLLKTLNNPYYRSMKMGVERAGDELGVGFRVLVRGGKKEDDLEAQVSAIHAQMRIGHLDAVVIAPASSTAIVPTIAELNAQRVKVVVVDTRLDPVELDKREATYHAFIGSDNEEGGRLAAEYMGRFIANEQRVVLVLEGVPSQETAISRARGFDEVVTSRFGRWRIIRKTADWNRQQGRLAVDAVLSTEGVPAGVFACNDEMALGAVAALEAYGAKPRSPEWPVIVGFDATNEALDAIRKDTVRGTIAQQPDKMGYEAVRLAAQLVRGESVQRDHLIPVKLIDERK